ncbi:MAG: glycosyltransferase [Bacteriovoracaceae bacterium]
MKKKIVIVSSLDNKEQRGGAYLRVHAIETLYQNLGFNTEIIYQENIQYQTTFSSYLSLLKFGKLPFLLFKKASVQLPPHDYLHLDNLRHFNWEFNSDAPVLFNAHNLEFENYYNRSSGFFAKNFQNWEISQYRKAKCVWVCSEREKEILVSLSPDLKEKILVIPNLVNKSDYYSSPKKYISFIGTLDYYPNQFAVKFILENLTEISSDYELLIAGRNPLPEQIEQCEKMGVTLKTNLSQAEIQKIFSETKILLVPLEHGSGTRLKIVEAIFSNAQVLSTSLGAEGIESKEIMISDLKDFSKNLNKILKREFGQDGADQNFSEQFDIQSWNKVYGNTLKGMIEA